MWYASEFSVRVGPELYFNSSGIWHIDGYQTMVDFVKQHSYSDSHDNNQLSLYPV